MPLSDDAISMCMYTLHTLLSIILGISYDHTAPPKPKKEKKKTPETALQQYNVLRIKCARTMRID